MRLSLLPAFALLSASPLQALVDTNSDGFSDIWESRYNATGLDPSADDDGDGATNGEEAAAGTNPFAASSVFRDSFLKLSNQVLAVQFASQPGKQYRLFLSPDMDKGSWVPTGDAKVATGPRLVLKAPVPDGDKIFCRVQVSDADTDGDGVSDWEERLLAGFDPRDPDSFSSGLPNNDFTAAGELMQALFNGEVGVTVEARDAYELEDSSAVVTASRSGATTYPLTIFFTTTGATDPTKSTAGPDDYVLTDGTPAPVPPIHELNPDEQPAPLPAPGPGTTNKVVTNFIVIPAASTSTELHVEPKGDSLLEPPEDLNVGFHLTGLSVLTRVCDASNHPDNTRLFVAYLSPEGGAITSATGISTVRLQGDNDLGLVNLSFSGLTSPQTAVHIHVKNPIAGPPVESLPLGQVFDHPWELQAAQFLVTEQQMLDALFNGDLYVNVHSENYPAGEIRGDYVLTNGSTEFQVPPPPPPIPVLAGEELDRDILRFLQQATFGPTVPDFYALRNLVTANGGDQMAAYTQWIDAHMTIPGPSLLDYNLAANEQEWGLFSDTTSPYYNPNFQPDHHNRRRGWWLMARHAHAQLRERTAFALSELFVISEQDSLVRNRSYGASQFHDTLKSGAFGTYRDLLEDVSTHPIMGHYLSHLRNRQAVIVNGQVVVSPDENYAREILQLFSIGLVMLHPDGSLIFSNQGLPIDTYDQEDIGELARVLTGWSFRRKNQPANTETIVDNNYFDHHNGLEYYEAQWTNPMKMFEDNGLDPSHPNYERYHDNNAKTIFHLHPALQLDIPAGQSGEQDLADIHDALAAHPNTGPFVARRMIQRFVTSNPSAGYIYRVAQVFENSGGSLGEMVKAILLDPEARTPQVAYDNDGSGKVKEPLVRYLHFLRAFDGKSNLPLDDLAAYGYPATELALFPAGTTRMRYWDTDNNQLGQTPQKAPSVFNWFLPDYTLAGPLASAGLVGPEFQITTENSVITNTNFHYRLIYWSNGHGTAPLPDQEVLGYGEHADHIQIDTSVLRTLYLSIVDENGDGVFDALDAGTFNNPQALHDASAIVVDGADLLLSAGGLKLRYGDTPGMPRERIIHAVECTAQYWNSNPGQQAAAMDRRIQAALWLVMSAPEGVVHK